MVRFHYAPFFCKYKIFWVFINCRSLAHTSTRTRISHVSTLHRRITEICRRRQLQVSSFESSRFQTIDLSPLSRLSLRLEPQPPTQNSGPSSATNSFKGSRDDLDLPNKTKFIDTDSPKEKRSQGCSPFVPQHRKTKNLAE